MVVRQYVRHAELLSLVLVMTLAVAASGDDIPRAAQVAALPRGVGDNLSLVASEEFLNRLISREQTQESPVRDFILGADVCGRQSTTTRVTVELRPDDSCARIEMLLAGVTRSNTLGVTNQATVKVVGNYRFQASKDVFFDGRRFSTRPPALVVDVHNQTVGAETTFSGIPLVGPLADNLAQRTSERKRPQSQAIAADRVYRRVVPEFNTTVDQQLALANAKLETDVRKQLENLGLLPSAVRACTSESKLYFGARFGQTIAPEQVRLSGTGTAETGSPADALVLSLHESFVNRVADQLHLEGASYSEKQLLSRAGKIVAGLLRLPSPAQPANDRSASEPGLPAETARIIFAEKDPLRFRMENGRVTILIRADFTAPNEEPGAPQLVSIPVRVALEHDKLVLEIDRVSVTPIAPPSHPASQFLHDGIIRQRIESHFPRGELTPEIRIPLGDKEVPLSISRIQATGGWLVLSFK